MSIPPFTVRYRAWLGEQGVTMRQSHVAGEKLFVDYAGVTLSITDPTSGEIKDTQIFVAVLGASNYTYAEVTASQKQPRLARVAPPRFRVLRRRS